MATLISSASLSDAERCYVHQGVARSAAPQNSVELDLGLFRIMSAVSSECRGVASIDAMGPIPDFDLLRACL